MQRSLVLNSSGLLQESDYDDNLFVNPIFEINQLGSTSYLVNGVVQLFSQWEGSRGGTAAFTVSYGESPTINQVGGYQGNSLLATVTTAQPTLSASDLAIIGQKFEGYDFRRIVGRPFTLSFWVRSNKVGIHTIAIRNANLTQSFVATYQISAANTWERKVITVPAPPVTSGTWNYTSGLAFYVHWVLSSGSNYATSQVNSWQSGNLLAVSGSVNVCDAVNNTFQLALVKLEPGAVATPFKHQDYQTMLRRCERFYCRAAFSFYHYAATVDSIYFNVSLPTHMRSIPTSALVSATSRTNINPSALPVMAFYNPREGYFYMSSAAAGFYGVFNDVWELNARL